VLLHREVAGKSKASSVPNETVIEVARDVTLQVTRPAAPGKP
jgi:hypothetical protein